MLLLLHLENIFNICLTFYSVLDYGSLFALHAYFDDMEWRACCFQLGCFDLHYRTIAVSLGGEFRRSAFSLVLFSLDFIAKLSYFSYYIVMT